MIVASPILFLLLIGVNPVSVFVPVGSILLAASFVFAPTVQHFMTCLVFVLLQNPYDVGDVVAFDGKAYRVENISLMTSTMITTDSKARHIFPHIVLAKKVIENDARSPHARAVVHVYVDPGITAAQLKEVHNRLQTFMTTVNPKDWLQPADPYVITSDVRPEDGKICITVWASTWVPWGKRKAALKVRGTLILALTEALTAMGIAHDRADNKIRMLSAAPGVTTEDTDEADADE